MTSEVADKRNELLLLRDEALLFRMARGYATMEAMKRCIYSSLSPYVTPLRHQFSDETLKVECFPDSHRMHPNPDILALLEGTGIVPIWVSLQSTHFLPPLDLPALSHLKDITTFDEG
jgi:hypothetical protein